MKKLLIVVLILIIILPLSLIIYLDLKNDNYEKNLLYEIYDNTNIDKIVYLNKDNNYYIVKTEDKVFVFDLNYEEVFNLDLSMLTPSNLDLVYRRNNLYYEEKIKQKDALIYRFYDVKTNELVYENSLGGA